MIGIIRNDATFEERDLGQLRVLSGGFKTFSIPFTSQEMLSDPSDERLIRFLLVPAPFRFRADSGD
jgi:hypothetical protein